MVESKNMFPQKGEERRFSPEDEALVLAFLRSHAARILRGEKRALPLPIYEAIQAATPQPVVEAVIIDGNGKYALHRRPADDAHFGANRLHILGGFEKANRHGATLADTAREMAKKEMGLQIEYVAGPIGTFQWKFGIEHPTGWPNSQIYVFRAVGTIPEREDTVWLHNDTLPPKEQMIIGRAGELHLDFLRVYQDWVKNPNQPCRDLNETPFVRPDAT